MRRYAALLGMIAALTLPAAELGRFSKATIPRPAPELAVKIPGGKQLLLSQYRGKVVAIEFLLTTCSHCQAKARVLQKLTQEYGKQGFQVLGVAVNQNAEALIKQFVDEQGLTWPVGTAATPETMYEFMQLSVMDRTLFPQIVFVDRKGVIQAQFPGEDPAIADTEVEKNFRTLIERLLKSSPTPAIGARKGVVKK